MRKFNFKLQSVHDWRESRREASERELARASAAVTAAVVEINEMESARAEAAERYAARLGAGEIDPLDAALSVKFLATLAERERAAHERLAELERAREAQLRQTADAVLAAKVTSRLRENQHARHTQAAVRAEQNQLDELATLASARRLTEK